MTTPISDIEKYCISKSTPPSPLAEDLANYTEAMHPLGHMVCGNLVVSFLSFIIKSHGVKSILELGTFTGFSSLAMAEALPEDGRITTIDKNKKINKFAQSYWEKSKSYSKITALFGDGKIVLDTLTEKYDLIFIDADKRGYLTYLEKSLNLLSENGIIIVDNVLWEGDVVKPFSETEDKSVQVMREFNDFVTAHDELEKVLLPLRDGLYLIRKK
ncbi:O-methyltransferase [Bacteriovorax sp. Seq25_V]|uniref:O-methyltransferase n=1 Tax=Bacteriovorax sp. Seq25_V TaxID=1201288 RepID=UPI000389E93C|nr:class I SAM-dependent methyltransferase [Bacteriovorax sp. Seq25_V]EQC47316.1 O-methyltransferase [Bacteriovorax sp. Seq25_V]